jgi:hypothetical protein
MNTQKIARHHAGTTAHEHLAPDIWAMLAKITAGREKSHHENPPPMIRPTDMKIL